jgi:hypothetical protein
MDCTVCWIILSPVVLCEPLGRLAVSRKVDGTPLGTRLNYLCWLCVVAEPACTLGRLVTSYLHRCALYHCRHCCGGHDFELERVDIQNGINMAAPVVDMRRVYGQVESVG